MSQQLYNLKIAAHTPRGTFEHKPSEGVTMEDINKFDEILKESIKDASLGELASLKLSGIIPRISWERIVHIPKELISQSVFEVKYTEIDD